MKFDRIFSLYSLSIWVLIASIALGMDVELVPLEVIIKNVGQGNCIIVKMPNKAGMHDILLVDCGSSSYNTPLAHATSPVTPLKEGFAEEASSRKSLVVTAKSETPLSLSKEEMIRRIKTKLQRSSIKAVVVTHPDKDHYNWISEILGSEPFGSLILGGAPDKYLNTSNSISTFIRDNFKRVFFTAVQDDKPTVGKLADGDYAKEPAFYPVTQEKFTNKLNFNKRFKIDLLAINSNHVTSLDRNPVTINTASKDDGTDDYNTDSIIIKITDNHTGKSIILTGDATGVTTTRLMDHAAKDEGLARLLKADVLVASHHGSSSHGTNNEAWIRTVDPEFIIISTGGSYGHPSKKAYEALHKAERLAIVGPHSVYVGGKAEDLIANHVTTAGIFSTLPHGDITIELAKNEILIKPANSRTRIFKKLESRPQEVIGQDDTLEPAVQTPSKLYKSISSIPEPKNYGELLNQLSPFKAFENLPIDLNDHRNEFVVDFLLNEKKLQEQEIESAKAYLIINGDTLIGKVRLELPAMGAAIGILNSPRIERNEPLREAELLIDLRDPRNIHLLRELKPLAASLGNPYLTSSPIHLGSPSEEETVIHKEQKVKESWGSAVKTKPQRSDFDEKRFISFINHIKQKHTPAKVAKKLKEGGIEQATDGGYVVNLSRGSEPKIHPLIWEKLKELFPEDYKAWKK